MPYIVLEKYYKGIYFRSNCLGWFACYRTQFLTDLFKDPFLSSVCVWMEEEEEEREEGRSGYRTKNKNTTRQCGEYWGSWLSPVPWET